MTDLHVSLVICTKDRPKDLRLLLESIVAQERAPNDIVIIDGSDQPVKDVSDSFQQLLPIRYVTLRPPGLTRQRNLGISMLVEQTDWVGFLDDDLELTKNCLKNLELFLRTNSKYSGVGLKIINQPNPGRSFFKELFLLDQYPGGSVTRSGAAAAIRPFEFNTEVEWLYGGATFWRLEVLKNYKYDEWYSGVGYCEDLDFSYRVSRKNELAICSSADCYHYHRQPGVDKMVPMGSWTIVAWWYFAREKNRFSRACILWSMLGLLTSNILKSILTLSRSRVNFSIGLIRGLMTVARGDVKGSIGFQK